MVSIDNPSAEKLERYRSIVPDWDAFLAALSRPLPLCIWANVLRTAPGRLRVRLAREGVKLRPLTWLPEGLKGAPSESAGQSVPFVAGHYHIQEEVSLLPVVLLDPQPGDRVLDLCAAPGNKTAQLAVRMKNIGTIVANDRDAMRMRATRGTLDRLGIVNTTITTGDAANFPPEAGVFDRVLADVPCTCEGTSRKHYTAFVRSGPSASERYHGIQVAILRKAVQLCRPGGRIAYATCTYAPEENEMVLDAALKEFGVQLRLLPARIEGVVSSPGVTAWNGRRLDPSLQRAMRVWPHQNDSGGFFVALLEKSHAADAVSASGVAAGELAVTDDERDHWCGILRDRFGIPDDVFDTWHLHRPNRKYVAVTTRDHETVPEAVSVGMPLMRIGLRFPKLTTAGARLIGGRATRNVVTASAEQTEAYLDRREFELSHEQKSSLTDTGYVIVRSDEIILGVGVYYEDGARVRSMFPKVLSRAVSN